MSENLRQYTKAIYSFEHVLRLAKSKPLTRKAPCVGWTAKDVVEHVFGNLAMVKAFASTGHGPKSTPKAGTDPMLTWAKLRDQTLEALDRPNVLHSIAHDPFGPDFGPMPVDALVGFMAADLTPHVWDLARATKVDEQLDPSLVKFTHAMWKALPEAVLRMPQMMGPPVKPPKGADAQTKMLGFLGRAV